MRIMPILSLVLFTVVLATVGVSSTEKEETVLPEEAEKRIINGVYANIREVPWQVSLRYNGWHTCGGSLLSSRLVVTAAHCVNKDPRASAYTVHLGAQYLSRNIAGEQVRRVERIYYHNYFHSSHFSHDVALIVLDRAVSYTTNIQKIKLPSPGSRIATGSRCLFSGWGQTYYGGPYAATLQKAILPIADPNHCKSRNGNLFPVDSTTMLCAGGQGLAGSCYADSGGPLACYEGGKWVLRGITSWIHKLCYTNYYTVFVRASTFNNWLRDTAAKAGQKIPADD